MNQIINERTDQSKCEYEDMVYATIQAALLVAESQKDYEVILSQCESIKGFYDVDSLMHDVQIKMRACEGKPDPDVVLTLRLDRLAYRQKIMFRITVVLCLVLFMYYGGQEVLRLKWRQKTKNIWNQNHALLEKYGSNEFVTAQTTFLQSDYRVAFQQSEQAIAKALQRKVAAERKILSERQRADAQRIVAERIYRDALRVQASNDAVQFLKEGKVVMEQGVAAYERLEYTVAYEMWKKA